MSLSNFGEALAYELLFRTDPIWVGLHTSDPGEDDSGDEVTGPTWPRQPVTLGDPVNGEGNNDAEILFDPAPSSLGDLTHFGIYDAAEAGNLLLSDVLDAPVNVTAALPVRFAPGALRLRFL